MSTWLVVLLLLGGAFLLAVARGGSEAPALPPPPSSPEERDGLEAQIRQHLLEGRKIDAIKLYRHLHGSGLKDAKEAVERMQMKGA